MIEQINLKEKTLEWFGRKQFRSKSRGTLWPSEASAEYIDEYGEKKVVGKCHRAVYYRLTGVEPTNPPTAKSQIIFLLGNSVEAMVTEAWKQMGIWENNSVKWEDKERNISGEFDVILREGDELYGAEVKSFYGYFANKQILGHWEGRGKNKRYIKGKPKDEHLMQAALYVDHSEGRLSGFKLVYVSRDNCDMAEFNITVDPISKDIFINGEKELRFTIADVYERYQQMNMFADNNMKPQREFELNPSDEKVKLLHERGEVSATAYKDHCSGKKKYNDWHCSYCDYKDHCWKVDTGEEPESVPEMHLHGSL